MKQFFLNLISNSSDSSSKRFGGLWLIGVVTVIVFYSLYKCAKPTDFPSYMFEGICWLISGFFMLSVVEKFSKKGSSNQQQNDINQQ